MPKLKTKNSYLNHLIRNQLTSLILYEQIKTTLANAKRLKPLAEKILTIAKTDDLLSRRKILKYIFDKKAVSKLFSITTKILEKSNKKIQIFKLGNRLGDNARQAIIRFHPEIQTIKKDEDNKKAKKS